MTLSAAIDTETTGLTPHHGCRPFMFQACDGSSNYVWEGEVNPRNRAEVRWSKTVLNDFLSFVDSLDEAIFHNVKFDVRMIDFTLRDHNITGFPSLIFPKIQDTIIASHAICSGESHALNYLAFKYLGWYNDTEKALKSAVVRARAEAEAQGFDIARNGHHTFGGQTKSKVSLADYWLVPDECVAYGLTDVEMTFLLWRLFKQVLLDESLWEPYRTRIELAKVFYKLENVGVPMYSELIPDKLSALHDKAEYLQSKIQEDNNYTFDIDLTKDQDLKFLLFKVLDLPITHYTPTGNASISKVALKQYEEDYPDKESVKDLAEFRKTKTQISDIESYQKWLCDDGRLRCSYWITGTRETRQAVEMPNLQNVSKGIRDLMGPPPGKVWLDMDLVNIEMRRWVYYVNNPEIIKVFESGGSFHLLVASILYPKEFEIYGEEFKNVYKSTYYQWVKNGNFAILYGAGEYKANQTYQVKGAYQKISRRLPEVPNFIQRCIHEAETNYRRYDQPYITVDGGYQLDVPLNEVFKSANFKVQGSAGWIMGEAMIEIDQNPDYRRASTQMIQQVHDSIVIEADLADLNYPLVESIRQSMIAPGLRYMPTNDASVDLITHYSAPDLVLDHTTQTIAQLP